MNLKSVSTPIRIIALLVFICSLSSCASKQSDRSLQSYNYPLWIHQARALVERHREVDLSNVTVSTAAGTGMLSVLYDLNQRLADTQTPDYLKDQAFRRSAAFALTSTVALYDPLRKNIVINEPVFNQFLQEMALKGIPRREAALTVLIHEMIHAADDIQYNLIELNRRHRGDKLGARMVQEGHAELQTEYICARAGCLEAFFSAHEIYTSYILNHWDSATPAIVDSSAFVYVHGWQFLKSLDRRDRTGSLVNQALRHPPVEAHEFFNADSFPDPARADRRAKLYDILETVKLSLPDQETRKPFPVIDLADLPINKTDRASYIARHSERTLASAGMTFYYRLDPQKFTSVRVELMETASHSVATRIAQQMEDTHRSKLQNYSTHSATPGATDWIGAGNISVEALERGQKIVQEVNPGSGAENYRFYTSLLVEGRYLIKVVNSNDDEVHEHVSTQLVAAIRDRADI